MKAGTRQIMRRRRALLLGLAAGLGACNFRPMLLAKAGDDATVRAELAAIEVRVRGGRLDYLVRNALFDELNPTSANVPERYTLIVQVRSRARALGIQLDNTITRFNLTVTAPFELREKGENLVLVDSSVEGVSSYNVSREPYADLIASQTAERRAAELVARQIGTLLGAYFARQAPVT
ncbi:MAG TPA: LPS assembly lipoprotein LptE [Geminicoccaceae bacterium]|nr:LPS assembly lipoprotein LptE [Geminicoccaceae bacterium]